MAEVNTHNKHWKEVFDHAREFLFARIDSSEALNINMTSEQTQFIRFNQSKVRQATQVEQGGLTLDLSRGKRVSSLGIEISFNEKANEETLTKALNTLKSEVAVLPEDPFFSPLTNEGESFADVEGVLPDADEFVANVVEFSKGCDLAGYFTSGLTCRGNANSLGQCHWFQSNSFFFDYSLYSAKEKAVKGSYAGSRYDKESLKAALDESSQALKVMDNEQVELKPGKYRCYLSPSAVNEIAGLLGWHALSAGAYKRGECPLSDLYEGKQSLSDKVSWRENFALGLNPRFNGRGEVSLEKLPIVTNGKMDNLLVSKNTENEYGLKSNQASLREAPRSLEMLTGELKQEDILAKIGTGLYISNLHYLNWSDKLKGRMTGMTRFGCLWVEEGKIVGPIKDLRFDETLYQIFGNGLEEVTESAQVIMETETYGDRSLGGAKLPGLLVNDFTFTL